MSMEGECVLGTDNNILRDAWRQDVLERLEFKKDQRRSGMFYLCFCSVQCTTTFSTFLNMCIHLVKGHRGNKWSQITIRMGQSDHGLCM